MNVSVVKSVVAGIQAKTITQANAKKAIVSGGASKEDASAIVAMAVAGMETELIIGAFTSEPEENVVKSARNLPGIRTMPANLLNVSSLLSCRALLMTEEAVRTTEKLWGGETPQGGNSAPV